MHAVLRVAAGLVTMAVSMAAVAQITFYEDEAFRGRSFTPQTSVPDFNRHGFNDRASSAVVRSGRWEICEDAGFRGRCVVLRPGQYPSIPAMGLDDRISSVRTVSVSARVDDRRYAPPPMVERDYRRRDRERLFEAPVTSVRAVMGAPEQRCWVEREQVPEADNGSRVPGLIFGAVIGGILGHQIGGGSGKDLATVGGAAAGAAVGANVGRDRSGRQVVTRDVQHCERAQGDAHPAYWDVGYDFRGRQHVVQLTSPPGPTVLVNADGEPRG